MNEENSKILYKYRPLYSFWKDSIDEKTGEALKIKSKVPILNKNTISLITKGELYFSNPSEFNDPYDTWLPIIPNDLTEKVLLKLMNSKERPQQARNLRRIARAFPGDLQEYVAWINENFTKNANQGEYFYVMNELFLNDYFVYCLSKKYNDILMWSHYAFNHTGICVGISTNSDGDVELNSSNNSFNKEILHPEKIKYSSNLEKQSQQKIDQFNIVSLKRMLLYKAKFWSYEEEYRLIVQQKSNDNNQILRLKGGSISKIFFGLKTPEEIIKQTIMEMSKSENLNFDLIKFYIMKDKLGFYELKEKEINPNNYL